MKKKIIVGKGWSLGFFQKISLKMSKNQLFFGSFFHAMPFVTRRAEGNFDEKSIINFPIYWIIRNQNEFGFDHKAGRQYRLVAKRMSEILIPDYSIDKKEFTFFA